MPRASRRGASAAASISVPPDRLLLEQTGDLFPRWNIYVHLHPNGQAAATSQPVETYRIGPIELFEVASRHARGYAVDDVDPVRVGRRQFEHRPVAAIGDLIRPETLDCMGNVRRN